MKIRRPLPDQNQAAAWLVRLLPDQNQVPAWSIRPLPDQNQGAAWSIRQPPWYNQAAALLIRFPVCEKSRCRSIKDLPCRLTQWPLLGWEHVPEVRMDAPHCTSSQGQLKRGLCPLVRKNLLGSPVLHPPLVRRFIVYTTYNSQSFFWAHFSLKGPPHFLDY